MRERTLGLTLEKLCGEKTLPIRHERKRGDGVRNELKKEKKKKKDKHLSMFSKLGAKSPSH